MSLILPDPELQLIIRKQLKEDVNTRDNYLKIIKEWMLQQSHLPDTWDDVRLMNFLRSCNFSLEKCKTKIDRYFSSRTAFPEFYSNRVFSSNQRLIITSKLLTIFPLPGLTENGCRITIYRVNNNVSEGFCAEDIIKYGIMLLDLRLGLELTGTSGDIIISDVSTVTMAMVSQFTLDFVKRMVIAMLESYPIKIKGIHIINSHPIVNTLFNVIKMFLKKKMRDRICMHSNNIETLYEFVPKELLPEELGGNAGKMQTLHEMWIEKLKEHEPWFKLQENVKTDESKRYKKPKDYDHLFGVEGSFAKLEVD